MPMDLKKELKKIAIDEDTSLSGLILKMIEENVEARKEKGVEEEVQEKSTMY